MKTKIAASIIAVTNKHACRAAAAVFAALAATTSVADLYWACDGTADALT